MEKYFCKPCNYVTTITTNAKTHFKSNKHILLCENCGIDPEFDITTCKKFIYECNHCDSVFTNRTLFWKHKKDHKNNSIGVVVDEDDVDDVIDDVIDGVNNTMKNKSKDQLKQQQLSEPTLVKILLEQNNTLVEQLKIMAEQNKTQTDLLKQQMNSNDKNASIVANAIDVAKETTNVTKKSMNMLKYANNHILEGQPIKKMKKKEAYVLIGYDKPEKKISFEEYEKHVKMYIHKYNHGVFVHYVGDMIVECYKSTDRKNANILTTDVSRLSFLVLQNVDKDININEKEWINDKSGKRFTSLLLTPLLNAFSETLEIYKKLAQSKNSNKNKMISMSVDDQMFQLNLLTDCAKLKRDLDNSIFTLPIVKYVAPHFHFDSYENIGIVSGVKIK